ncbi:hypothetical protein [Bdellovibrio svalbardensis]|uniref:Uncharacterized protein n=1 Tax=Bdellovibrio svalbardensis TaxID=2972972 RepID=A0ABT6DJ33_9BACT|nr:hypothetical protein [Bdellovibrio svalbardensis]MDG0815088.1 hypothetical protein [Bdellovibrio svalbardensis]
MKTIIALVLLFSINSYANNWYDRGNGGFVLLCQGQQPQVLDLYEASTRFNLPPVPTKSTETLAKASELISRLSGIDSHRAKLFKDWLDGFLGTASFVGGSFAKTPDLGAVLIPDNCQLEQVIVQQQPSVVNNYRYLINSKLWNQLDPDNQAALIVHELIYREFISTPSQEFSSERVRYFNAFIHSDLPGIFSLKDYIAKLQDVHISRYQYNDLMIFLGAANSTGEWISSPVNIDEGGRIRYAALSSHQSINKPYFNYLCFNLEASPRMGAVFLSKEGKLLNVEVDPQFASSMACPLPYFQYNSIDSSLFISGTKWRFDENEQVVQIQGAPLTTQAEFSYKGTVFVSPSSLATYSSQDSIFGFDRKMNLIEIGLGGVPCRTPYDSKIRFTPDLIKSNVSVSLSETGEPVGNIRSCY